MQQPRLRATGWKLGFADRSGAGFVGYRTTAVGNGAAGRARWDRDDGPHLSARRSQKGWIDVGNKSPAATSRKDITMTTRNILTAAAFAAILAGPALAHANEPAVSRSLAS